jgi:hypothetical protein
MDRATYYEERNAIPTACANRYVAFETLHPVAEWLVPAVLRVRDRGADLPLTAAVDRTGDVVTLDVNAAYPSGHANWNVAIDLAQREIRTSLA